MGASSGTVARLSECGKIDVVLDRYGYAQRFGQCGRRIGEQPAGPPGPHPRKGRLTRRVHGDLWGSNTSAERHGDGDDHRTDLGCVACHRVRRRREAGGHGVEGLGLVEFDIGTVQHTAVEAHETHELAPAAEFDSSDGLPGQVDPHGR